MESIQRNKMTFPCLMKCVNPTEYSVLKHNKIYLILEENNNCIADDGDENSPVYLVLIESVCNYIYKYYFESI
jgi:hypothetical protein